MSSELKTIFFLFAKNVVWFLFVPKKDGFMIFHWHIIKKEKSVGFCHTCKNASMTMHSLFWEKYGVSKGATILFLWGGAEDILKTEICFQISSKM